MRRSLLFLPLSLLLFPFTANTQQPSNDCSLTFKGSHRKAVKNRTRADGADYEIFREGQPISINEWFSLTCSLDAPNRIPATKPIDGVETMTVTLEGFLVGFKFERNRRAGDGKDNDLHLEIAPSKRWNSRHVIAEIPPGQAYCEARNKVWRLQQADGSDGDGSGDRHIFNNPKKVRVTGYVFLDSAHAGASTVLCQSSGGRGIRKDGMASRVKGLWEIHPVLALEVVN